MGTITQVQKSILLGLVLGDGYIRKFPGRKNALLEVNHSFKQKEYVDWLYGQLKNLVKTPPKARDGNGGRIAYRFFMKQHSVITELMQYFYRDRLKIVPKGIQIDEIALAIWFIDDGSSSGGSFYLNTQKFDLTSQENLTSVLKNKFEITTRLNRDKSYWRIRINKESKQKFQSLIEPLIIPSMRYKLGYRPVETSHKHE